MRRSLRETGLLAARSLRRTLRNRSVLVSYLFQPLLYLLVFTRVFDSVQRSPGFVALGYDSYLSFFLPGLLVFAVLAPAMTSGLGMVIDLHTGALDGFLRTPVRRSSLLSGRLVADAARMLISTTLLVVVAAAVGASLGGPFRVLGAIGLACGLGVGLAGLSNLIALRIRSAETTNALANLTVVPLMFLSTAYMPRPLLPRWLQLAASANPLSYVIDAARSLLAGGGGASQLLVAAVIVAVLAAASLAGSAAAFRRAVA